MLITYLYVTFILGLIGPIYKQALKVWGVNNEEPTVKREAYILFSGFGVSMQDRSCGPGASSALPAAGERPQRPGRPG